MYRTDICRLLNFAGAGNRWPSPIVLTPYSAYTANIRDNAFAVVPLAVRGFARWFIIPGAYQFVRSLEAERVRLDVDFDAGEVTVDGHPVGLLGTAFVRPTVFDPPLVEWAAGLQDFSRWIEAKRPGRPLDTLTIRYANGQVVVGDVSYGNLSGPDGVIEREVAVADLADLWRLARGWRGDGQKKRYVAMGIVDGGISLSANTGAYGVVRDLRAKD